MDRRLAAMYGRQFCFRSRQIVYFSICLVRIPPAIHLTENTRLFCPKTVCPQRMILSVAGNFLLDQSFGFCFPYSVSISEKKHLYSAQLWQSYVCGKKNAFFGKCWSFQESKGAPERYVQTKGMLAEADCFRTARDFLSEQV